MTARDLHERFLDGLKGAVNSHSDPSVKPLDVDLAPPLPRQLRVYLYRASCPPGGRAGREYKIQLLVSGQNQRERAAFDNSSSRLVILAGYVPEYDVFVLWDAGLYADFTYNRNVQVRATTVYEAFAGKVAEQNRELEAGQETVIACETKLLARGLRQRQDRTLERLLGAQS